jgi:hypothetical protein
LYRHDCQRNEERNRIKDKEYDEGSFRGDICFP